MFSHECVLQLCESPTLDPRSIQRQQCTHSHTYTHTYTHTQKTQTLQQHSVSWLRMKGQRQKHKTWAGQVRPAGGQEEKKGRGGGEEEEEKLKLLAVLQTDWNFSSSLCLAFRCLGSGRLKAIVRLRVVERWGRGGVREDNTAARQRGIRGLPTYHQHQGREGGRRGVGVGGGNEKKRPGL